MNGLPQIIFKKTYHLKRLFGDYICIHTSHLYSHIPPKDCDCWHHNTGCVVYSLCLPGDVSETDLLYQWSQFSLFFYHTQGCVNWCQYIFRVALVLILVDGLYRWTDIFLHDLSPRQRLGQTPPHPHCYSLSHS